MMRRLVYETFTRLVAGEWDKLERASHNPREAQLARLKDILRNTKGTAFARDFRLASVKSYEDFQSAVKINEYQDFLPYIERMIAGEQQVLTRQKPFMYATTSGTTGRRKYIPITKAYMNEFRRASKVSCLKLYQQFPDLAQGTSLAMLSTAMEGVTPGGTPYGAMSGALYLMEPELVRRQVFSVPYEVYTIKDYETRYYCILRIALADCITQLYTLNPSTIVLLARRLKEFGPRLTKDLFDGTLTAPDTVPHFVRDKIKGMLKADKERANLLESLLAGDQFVPHKVWPKLQVVSCWTKAAAAFYMSDFPELLGDAQVCDISYGASEGRGTIFLSQKEQMLAIRSHFYEFVPEDEIDSPNPTTLLADELSVGERYYILFTTSGGLVRYHINDLIKVTGFHNRTPLIEFQHKGGKVFSFTGEKITELQVTEAMSEILKENNIKIRYFTVVPEFRPNPHYKLWLEPSAERSIDADLLLRLGRAFDDKLSSINVEYEVKRESSRLDPVHAQLLALGTYEDVRKTAVASGVPDSQFKLSHLMPSDEDKQFFASRLIDASVLV